MGDENLDDKIMDIDMQNGLLAMELVFNTLVKQEKYEDAKKMYWSWKRVGQDYIDFRLKHYDSEGRKVIREVYKVLGYNPYLPMKRDNDEK
jgi:hypothetical protein